MMRTNSNPRGSWLVWLLLLPIVIVAAVFGFVVFLAVLALTVSTLLIVFVRLWWLQRKLKTPAARGGALEGEFVVVREEVRHDGEPPGPPR